MIVLDASMALAWLIERIDQQEKELAKAAFAEIVAAGTQVPSLWYAEVANTLLVFERAKRLTEQQAVQFLADLSRVSITEDEQPVSLLQSGILALGRRYRLTAYDATYLELAMRKGAALASFDGKLVEAARVAGVRVFGDAG